MGRSLGVSVGNLTLVWRGRGWGLGGGTCVFVSVSVPECLFSLYAVCFTRQTNKQQTKKISGLALHLIFVVLHRLTVA